MGILADLVAWFGDPATWAGSAGIPRRSAEHALLCGVALAAALAVALPAGLVLGHLRRGRLLGAAIVNLGRAVPTLALLILALLVSLRLGLGLGFWPSVLTLFLVALHPIFTNAYTAVADVDAATVDAARGMGLTGRQVLLGVEVPLAAPLVLAAVRLTAVQVVATAPLAALVAGGGLGRFIVDGFQRRDHAQLVGGIVLVAVASLLTEALFDLVERAVVPRGVQRVRRDTVAAHARAI